jgi:hypothetical protein
MPAEYLRLLAVDQKSHSPGPEWMLDAGQSPVLCFLYYFKNVTTFESVTALACAASYLDELRACLAFFGR